MLSNKWTFSLKILVVMLALAFVGHTAMAAEFGVTLSVGAGVDASSADNIQVDRTIDLDGTGSDLDPGDVVINVKFDQVVNADNATTGATDATNGTQFRWDDLQIIAYNEFGGIEVSPGLDPGPTAATTADGKNFTIVLDAPGATVTRILVFLAKHKVEVADPRAFLTEGVRNDDGKSAEASIALYYVAGEPEDEAGDPTVYSIRRASDPLLPVTAATENVIILLSEQPKAFTKDNVDVTNATWVDPVALVAVPEDPDGLDNTDDNADDMPSTGRDMKLYPYVLTITPTYPKDKPDIVVKVKAFDDMVLPTANKYPVPAREADYVEGMSKLTIKAGTEVLKDLTAGIVVFIPENTVIPKDGYVVVVKDADGSAVRDPGGADKSPVLTARKPFGLTYNRVAGTLPNLETLLLNGGTIDIVGAGSLIISEIMWGSDASIEASVNSQYIEIRNTSGAEIKAAKEAYKLVFYTAGATLPDASVAANNVQDRVGTVGASGYWSVAGKGQSGRSGVGEAPGDLAAVTPTEELISMQRVIDATGVAADGTAPASWAASTPPGLNFDPNIEGVRIGSPGRAPTAYPTAPVVAPPAPTVAAAMPEDIMISEIMVDTGGGRLPQWIELSNVSGKEVSLAGWSVLISNSAADDDVVGASVSINLSGTLDVSAHTGNTGKGQSLLLVAWGARSSSQINADLVMNVSSQVGEAGRYTLISEMGFMVALVPPQTTGVLTYGDAAGNLNEGWELPTADGARSSLIRREADALGAATMGTMANGWVLASDTALVSGPVTWYGSDEDAGTPGYDAGGPLPVQLSHFRPARDKETGAAVITWSTQSELNNAGFFIKRSQQRDGQFKIINAAMIQGAGTISEKQFYTYTDTTAQPNVVYYYQIEDVSLDGNRQTLTNGTRLKGHIGAAGKLTTLWGDLKTQE